MKTLITGGTGFVGRKLTEVLLEAGESVVVPSRDPARARGTFPSHPALEFVPWNGSEDLDLTDMDRIVHLAGEPAVGRRYTEALKDSIYRSRVETAQALVSSLRAAGPRAPGVLLSASGVGFYGPREAKDPCFESDPPGRDFLARVCVDWEKAVCAAEALGVRVAILRLGVVLGRDGGALSVMTKPFQMFVGGPLGDGEQMFPWVHQVDVVAAIRFLAADSNARGPFNVVAPDSVSNEEFSRALGRALKRPSALRTPAFALRALFGEGAEPLLTGQRAAPHRLTEAGFSFRYPKVDAALEDCLA